MMQFLLYYSNISSNVYVMKSVSCLYLAIPSYIIVIKLAISWLIKPINLLWEEGPTCILLFQETKVERKRKSRRTHSPSASRVSNPVDSLKKQKTDKGGNCVVEIIVFYICVLYVHKYVALVTN